jgi:hypothetical protein
MAPGGGSRWRLGAGSWDRGGGGFVLTVAFAEEGAAPTFGLPATTTAPWTPPRCRPLHRGTPRHRTWRGSLLRGVPSPHSTAGGPRAPIWVGGRGGFGAGAGRDFRGRDEISDSVGLSPKVVRNWRARSRESVEPGGCNSVHNQFDAIDLGAVTSFHVERESRGERGSRPPSASFDSVDLGSSNSFHVERESRGERGADFHGADRAALARPCLPCRAREMGMHGL